MTPGLPFALTPGLPLGLIPGLPLGLLPGLPFGPHPCNSLCLGREPKARVATIRVTYCSVTKVLDYHIKQLDKLTIDQSQARFFFPSLLWSSHTDNHLQEDLARFGYSRIIKLFPNATDVW